jgi:methanogenic corrinoid protein MtbC1
MEQSRETRILGFERALLTLDRSLIKSMLTGPEGQPPAMGDLETIIVPALERIGKGWEEGRVSLSQVYMSGRICEDLLDMLLPPLVPEGIDFPHLAIAVLEDYHLLGLRLVYSILRISGFSVSNYGRQDLENLVGRVRKDDIKILLVSVLMLRSALRIGDLHTGLEAAGCHVKLVVGGAPFRFDKHLWHQVGADATSETAAGAVGIIQRLLPEVRS